MDKVLLTDSVKCEVLDGSSSTEDGLQICHISWEYINNKGDNVFSEKNIPKELITVSDTVSNESLISFIKANYLE